MDDANNIGVWGGGDHDLVTQFNLDSALEQACLGTPCADGVDAARVWLGEYGSRRMDPQAIFDLEAYCRDEYVDSGGEEPEEDLQVVDWFLASCRAPCEYLEYAKVHKVLSWLPGLAANEALPLDEAHALLQRRDLLQYAFDVRRALATRPLHLHTAKILATDCDEHVQAALGVFDGTHEEVLRIVSESTSNFAAASVLRNRNTPPDVVARLTQGYPEGVVVRAYLCRADCREDALARWEGHTSAHVRVLVASTSGRSAESLMRLAKDRSGRVRRAVFYNPEASSEIRSVAWDLTPELQEYRARPVPASQMYVDDAEQV